MDAIACRDGRQRRVIDDQSALPENRPGGLPCYVNISNSGYGCSNPFHRVSQWIQSLRKGGDSVQLLPIR